MPIPHQEMRRIIKRRIHGTEGTERIRVLRESLKELPGFYTGPYGELRKWVQEQIEESTVRRSVKHQDEYHVPKEGCAQVILVGPTNAGKSTLLRTLTGRPVAVGNYRFTTLRPAAGAVNCGGAKVQLVDLPGLVEGAREGAGGGRILLACIRSADAMVYCLPAERDGFDEGLVVVGEVKDAGIAKPAGVVITKGDLPGAEQFVSEAAALFPGLPVVVTSQDGDQGAVVELVWGLLDFIRVWPAPKGERAEVPVVLERGATLEAFVESLDKRWVQRVRTARVTGPSARFDGQAVGLAHALADGDTVDLALHA
jgi:ribosome-interacting GTPase 1